MYKKIIFFIVIVLILALFIASYVVTFNRAGMTSHYSVDSIHAERADVHLALELSYITEHQTILEGGTYGGLVTFGFPADAVLKLFPNAKEYVPQKSVVLWTYEFKPTNVIQEGNFFGDGWLSVEGHFQHDGAIYYCIIPARLTNRVSQIRCVEAIKSM